jgi:hypothetical protein
MSFLELMPMADVGTAIVVASLIGGGAAVGSAAIQSRGRKKVGKIGGVVKPITPKEVTKKSARSAIVAGSPQGVLSPTATSGRGTLLGN